MPNNVQATVARSKRTKKKAPPRFLSRDDLYRRGIDYSVSQLRRLWQSGKFPKPVPLSARKLAWLESEVDEWFAARIRER